MIEAMKVFNEIPAETRGKIVAVLVEDEEPVDFGRPCSRSIRVVVPRWVVVSASRRTRFFRRSERRTDFRPFPDISRLQLQNTPAISRPG